MLDFSFTEFYSFVLSLVSMFLCYRVRSITSQYETLVKRLEELQRELDSRNNEL